MTKLLTASTVAALAVLWPRPAAAQLDPLLFLKKTQPNVLIAIDTSDRMQYDFNNDYRDPTTYSLNTSAGDWESKVGITANNYRRKFVGFVHDSNDGSEFKTDHLEFPQLGTAAYNTFDAGTRFGFAKAAITEAFNVNTASGANSTVRFGLVRTRRIASPVLCVFANGAPDQCPTVTVIGTSVTAINQRLNSPGANGTYAVVRPHILSKTDGTVTSAEDNGLALQASSTSNANFVSKLNGLIPAGKDAKNQLDSPTDLMLDDLKSAAKALIDADTDCRNTVAVMIVGGARGTTSNGDTAVKATAMLNVSKGHRVPVYVILLSTAATTDDERAKLKAVAANSGGQFFEVTPADAAASGEGTAIPSIVRAINIAVSHAFVDQATFDKAPDAAHPYGYSTTSQVTSPIVGSVNLAGAKDINGVTLPDTVITTKTGEVIPQRSNLMITTGFDLPGFTASLRAFRVYKPVVDESRPSGYQFKSDGTRLWVASAPAAASRNIYTATPDGKIIKFAVANAAILQPYLLSSSVTEAENLISFIRSQPLGAIVDSTPAIMDPPSLDPPPDSDYPGFAAEHKDRRAMIWVGANDGMMHGIDARIGQEVWAFIPFNLLPKLNTLLRGQPIGDFRYFVDGSPKVSDVKIGGKWRTFLVMGEGPGGTFYQTFDVTLEDMSVDPASDNVNDVLSYFSHEESVGLQWAFPRYSSFDWKCTTTGDCPNSKWGDLSKTSASAVEKTVGQTWSDPAIGQIETAAGRYTVLTGSGFFRYSRQQDPNRGGVVAGRTFYLLDAADGTVLDSKDVGSDNKGETVDDCTANAAKGCTELKNALQADPVATGPADSRFITKAYLGDLDGRIWRFDIGLDGAKMPKIKALVNLYTISTGSGSASDHPVFASMATVNVGSTNQYLFVGTGSDLLPSTKVSTSYALLVVLDQGPSGSKVAQISLAKTDGLQGDEKVSAFPAVAGDIVFFSTTTYYTGGCFVPDANLYAFTFIGGPAYDTTGDGKVTSSGNGADSTKVRTTTGARASAPFIVDQHLVFATGSQIEMFGDPTDFNNGVGQAGVRILSWREVR